MNIKIEENIIFLKECEYVLSVIEDIGQPTNPAEGDPSTGYYEKSVLLEADIFAYGILETVSERVLSVSEKEFGLSLAIDKTALIKVVPGNTIEEHADSQNLDGTPKFGCDKFIVSAVVYLNNGFTGGDLVFPRIEYRYKPIAGNCLIFPSALPYGHYVDKVLSGERMSFAIWFSKI